MADITSYVALIEAASRGEDVRDAIVDALNAINEESAWSAIDTPEEGSTRLITSGGVHAALLEKQDLLSIDATPAQNSVNPVSSGGVYAALAALEPDLEMDDVPTEGSGNPVKSGGIYDALQEMQGSLVFDDTPTAGSQNPVTSDGVYYAMTSLKASVKKASVTLSTEWEGNGPFTQEVEIAGASAFSKVDIQPDAGTIGTLLLDGVKALWIMNNAGTLTACCLGAVPSTELTIQCTLEEIDHEGQDLYDAVPTENSGNLVISGGVFSALAAKQDLLVYDSSPIQGSANVLSSGAVYEALSMIEGAVVDDAPSSGSGRPVSSGGVYTALEGKLDAKEIDPAPTEDSGNLVSSGGVYEALAGKQDILSFDGTPVNGSTKPVTSGGVYAAIKDKQDRLFFDDEPTEGSGRILTSGAVYSALSAVQSSLVFDDEPTEGSQNPVTSDGVYQAISGAGGLSGLDELPTAGSSNAVKSNGLFSVLAGKQPGIWSASATLGTGWSGNGPYTQTVTIAGTTQHSMVELKPDLAVITRLKEDGVESLWIQNSGGTLTAYALGAKPSTALTIQCTVTEVGGAGPSGPDILFQIDAALSATSKNAVQNKAVNAALEAKESTGNKSTQITAASTDTEYPSAKAVWALFSSIIDGDGVEF